MAIALSSIMMYYAIQFIGSDGGILLARDLDYRLDLYYIIYFGEVHMSLTKHEAFKVDDEDFGQRIYLCLLRYIPFLATKVAV